MPWRVTIEKYLAVAGEYWTNVYFLDASNQAEAETAAANLTSMERQFHAAPVLFTKWRVDDGQPNTDVYKTQAVNLNGSRDNGLVELMPLFVCCRVDISVAGGGRPSRKYYRGVLLESDVNGMTINGSFILNSVATAFIGAPLGDIADPDNQAAVSASVSPIVAMRQLRRGSKKKLTP